MAETYVGEVRNGVVVFEGTPPPLPEGTKVRIEPVDMESALEGVREARGRVGRTPHGGVRPTESLGFDGGPRLDESRLDPPYTDPMTFSYTFLHDLSALLMAVAGKASGLPSDLAENHDHYLHGTPKRIEQAGFRALLRPT